MGAVQQLLVGTAAAAAGGNTFSLDRAGPAATQSSGATITTTHTGSTAVGTLTIVTVTQEYGANSPKTITAVSDSVDLANFTFLVSASNAGNQLISMFGRVHSTAGTRSAICTFSGGSADACISMNTYASSGTITLGPTISGTATNTAMKPGNVSPTGTALYVVAGVWNHPGEQTATATAGWNARQNTGGAGAGAAVIVQDLFGSGLQNPTMVISASRAWACAAVTYT